MMTICTKKGKAKTFLVFLKLKTVVHHGGGGDVEQCPTFVEVSYYNENLESALIDFSLIIRVLFK